MRCARSRRGSPSTTKILALGSVNVPSSVGSVEDSSGSFVESSACCSSVVVSCTTLLRALMLSMYKMLCDGLRVDSPKAAAETRGLTPSIPLSASEAVDDVVVACDEDNPEDEESLAADTR